MKDDWSVLAENAMIELVDGKEPFLPNIEIELSYGHTVGMMLPKLTDGTETIMYMADLIPMAAHIPLPWIMGYDLNAMKTLEEKSTFLKEAAEKNWLLFFYHDPKTIAVKIKKSEKYFDIIEEYLVNE